MRVKAKHIATIVILIIGFYLWQVYNAAKTLSFAFGKITGFRLSGGLIEFTLFLRTTNGDATAIPLTGVNINNVFGKSIIGKAILEKSVFISGRTVTDVPIRVLIPYSDLILLVPELLAAISSKKVSFALQGSVSAVGITVPVNQPYVLDLSSIFK